MIRRKFLEVKYANYFLSPFLCIFANINSPLSFVMNKTCLFAAFCALTLLSLHSCGTKENTNFIPVQESTAISFLDDMSGSRTYLFFEDSLVEASLGQIYGVMIDDGKVFVSNTVSLDQWHTSIEGICVFDMDGKFLMT